MHALIVALTQGNAVTVREHLTNMPPWLTSPLPDNLLSWQLIHFAASLGLSDMVELLITQGAVSDALDNQSWQPAHIAAFFGHTTVLQSLFRHGVNIHAQNKEGENLAFMTVLSRSLGAMRYLLGCDVDIHARTRYGESAVTLAIKKGYLDCIIEIFSTNRYFKQFKTEQLYDFFVLALKYGHLSMADYFYDLMGLELHQLPGIPAELTESTKHYLDLLQKISAKDFQLSTVSTLWSNANFSLPLQLVIVRLLMTRKDLSGVHEVIQNLVTQLIAGLNPAEFWITLFNTYTGNTLISLIKALPQLSPNHAENLNQSPIFFAIMHDRVNFFANFATYLELDVNQLTFHHGYSLMHLVAYYNASECMRHLTETLHVWPSPTSVDSLGDTVLHTAVRHESEAIVKFLIEDCHFDVNLLNTEGNTSLDLAFANHHKNIIRLLITAGAQARQQDRSLLEQQYPLLARRVQRWEEKIQTPHESNKQPIRIVVAQGGGVRGAAFLPALLELSKESMIDLAKLDIAGGTSAGAITVLILSLGYQLSEAEEMLKNLNFYELIDKHLRNKFFALKKAFATQDGIKAFLGERIYALMNQIFEMMKSGKMDLKGLKPLIISYISANHFPTELQNITRLLGLHHGEYQELADEFLQLKRKLDPFLTAIKATKGIFSGELLRLKFVEWIVEKGFDPNLTFAQLHARRLADKRCKDLYVVAYHVKTKQTRVFSHKTTPDAIVADAVRCSMSIPLFFAPHGYYVNRDGQRVLIEEEGFHYDGGPLDNYILKFFDKFEYLPHISLPGYQHNEITNPQALGLRLVSSEWFNHYENGGEKPTYEIRGMQDFLVSILSSVYTFTKQESDFALNPAVQERTLFIDCHNVHTLDFDLTPEMKNTLLDYGRAGARAFIIRYRALQARQQTLVSPLQLLRAPSRQVDFQGWLARVRRVRNLVELQQLLAQAQQNLAMIRDAQGNTLFHHAVMNADLNLLRLLYDLSKTLAYDNNDALKPLDMVTHCKELVARESVLNFFEEINDWNSTLLVKANVSFIFNWQRRAYLLREALRYQSRENHARLPSEDKQQDILKRLSSDAPPIIPSRYSNKQLFAMTYACVLQNKFSLLQHHGLSMNCKDAAGWTVMHHLVKQNQKSLLGTCFLSETFYHHVNTAQESLLDMAIQIETFSTEDTLLQRQSMVAFLLRRGVYRCRPANRALIISLMENFNIIDPRIQAAFEEFKHFDQSTNVNEEYESFLRNLEQEKIPQASAISLVNTPLPSISSKNAKLTSEDILEKVPAAPVTMLPFHVEPVFHPVMAPSSSNAEPVLIASSSVEADPSPNSSNNFIHEIPLPPKTQALLSFMNERKAESQPPLLESSQDTPTSLVRSRGFLGDIVNFNKTTLNRAPPPPAKPSRQGKTGLASFLEEAMWNRRVGLHADMEDGSQFRVHVYDAREKAEWYDKNDRQSDEEYTTPPLSPR